ncbi:O-antigen polymerase [Pseudomonas sp. KNUC1026]|uniref:O-antigen polymerase n=1 Tax=Pseudomonas sp. KNUC1026 TaxID=2893890 RepID=UPI001F44FD17|nr:O-antigen polymerase [Pseudomonas sp. KNUC1026]UFH48250.1 oligosaccharide repeat unit polymerase [Pseudomonas sp. KNUC1026]
MEILLSAEKLVSIFLSILILLISLISKRVYRSWLAPGVVFSLAWFVYTFIPLLGAWYIPITPWGVSFIFLYCASFSLGGLFFVKSNAYAQILPTPSSTSDFRQNHCLSTFAMGFSLIVLICMLINLYIQGFTLESLIFSPLSSGLRYLLLRYDGLLIKNVFLSIDTTLNYVAICLAGATFSHQRNRLRSALLVATCFAPSILHLILYADKGTLFLGIAVFYGAILTSRIARSEHALITLKTLKVLAPCALLSIFLILIAFLSRTHGTPQPEKISHIIFYFNSYFFGHLYAFSDWINHYVLGISATTFSLPKDYTSGHYTFLVLMQQIETESTVPDGFYSEYYRYSNLLQSNIYTMFRGVIQDFGISGSLLFAFGTGLVFHYCYLKLKNMRQVLINSAIYTFFFCYTYNSFLISMFSWSNPLLAIIVAYCFLEVFTRGWKYKKSYPNKFRTDRC